MEGIRCIGGCNKAVEAVELGLPRYWSNPESWSSGELPIEGDTVEIEPGVNMIFDIAESPVLKLLTINGRLTFDQPESGDVDLHLKSYHIFVNIGELFIGSAEKPFTANAQITLSGEASADTITYSGAIEAGNKVISNVGTIKMYGTQRSRMSRLLSFANKEDDFIVVDQGLDWKAGDRIFLAPTGHNPQGYDYRDIVDYSADTGRVGLSAPLDNLHYGAPESTADKLSGLDRRCEVVLLTRNVRIVGEDTDGWGGQVVTSDTIDSNGDMVSGLLEMDSVELYRCSQRDTFKAAIRFEGAMTNSHKIHNVVAHEGLAWGLYIKASSNVDVKDSSFIGFFQTGANIHVSNDITIDGMFVMDVKSNTFRKPTAGHEIEKEACVAVASYWGSGTGDGSKNITIKNSIAAGCVYAGFVAPGHACGESATQ